MDSEVKDVLVELINTLLASNTRNHDDGVIQHDHEMFDNVDAERLELLRDNLLSN